jgi:hypothetical protein
LLVFIYLIVLEIFILVRFETHFGAVRAFFGAFETMFSASKT